MRIEVVYFRGCPNSDLMRRHVATACAELGVPPPVEWEYDAADFPETYRWYGSPTLLIDGRDPFGAEPADERACRFYADGLPTMEVLTAILRKAGEA